MTDDVLAPLLAAAADYAGGQPSDAFVAAANAYFARVREDDGLVERTALALGGLPPIGAGIVAQMLGSVVEGMGEAGRSFLPLWNLFVDWCALLLADGPLPAGLVERAAAVVPALRVLAPAVVSHLAALPARRAELGADGATLSALEMLEPDHHGALWVLETLRKHSDRVLLLHPQSRRGWWAHYENVSMCFHLFSLLQCAVGARLEGGREPDAAVLAAATGSGDGPDGTGSNEPVSDGAWWHYGHALAPAHELAGSIWGEARAASIPRVDDHQVIVLWPPILRGRSWDSSFFTPHLQQMPASFSLDDPLSPQDCDAWFARLKLERPPLA